jgi:hypothetical protein
MNMPGFAGDASLYRTNERYFLTSRMANLAAMGVSVAPSIGQCPVGCGPCVADVDSSTGCSRTCQRADCSTSTGPCKGCSHTTTCGPCTGTKTCCTGPFCQGVACSC